MPIYSFLFSLCDGGHRAVWRGPRGSIDHGTQTLRLPVAQHFSYRIDYVLDRRRCVTGIKFTAIVVQEFIDRIQHSTP